MVPVRIDPSFFKVLALVRVGLGFRDFFILVRSSISLFSYPSPVRGSPTTLKQGRPGLTFLFLFKFSFQSFKFIFQFWIQLFSSCFSVKTAFYFWIYKKFDKITQLRFKMTQFLKIDSKAVFPWLNGTLSFQKASQKLQFCENWPISMTKHIFKHYFWHFKNLRFSKLTINVNIKLFTLSH